MVAQAPRTGEGTGGEGLIDALDALNVDQTLGRYELLAPIGRGGMAIVWAARLKATRGFSKIVALKTMLPALSADPRFERMFLAEAEISSRIKHPNVCDVLDVGESDGLIYLVMEWIDGEPLSALLAEQSTVDEAVAARIVAQAARGLQAAHELTDDDGGRLSVVHRDVSPQNILVTHDGTVKVVDFGVAKAAQRSDNVTATGFVKGKVAYLAPEQIQRAEVDARADVFALGVVLYEMVCGNHPFRGETELATMLAITAAETVSIPECVSVPLRDVLAKALSKEPAARQGSMRELASELDAVAPPSPDAVGAFVREVLGPRRAERARQLREAIDAADARALRKAYEVAAAEPVAMPRPPRGRRGVALVVAALAGAGIGAAAIGRFGATPAAPAVPVVHATESAAPIAVASAPRPEPSASAPPPSASSAAVSTSPVRVRQVPSPPPSAAPAASASVLEPAASGPPPTRFREPGF